MDIEKAIVNIDNGLETISRELITRNINCSKQDNLSFLENPDSVWGHSLHWHQWGIITHSRMSLKFYQELPQFLDDTNLTRKINKDLRKKINNTDKGQLLPIAYLYHDLGKFVTRTKVQKADGTFSFTFTNHEEASKDVIKSPLVLNNLKILGFTDTQIEYISNCAGLHYELGKLRDTLLKNEKYTETDISSTELKTQLCELMIKNIDYSLEIGLMFLIDSLAKQEIHMKNVNDIDRSISEIKRYLRGKSLSLKLIDAIYEFPNNYALAIKYLEIWKNT